MMPQSLTHLKGEHIMSLQALINSNAGIDPFDLLFRNALNSVGYQPFSGDTKLDYPCDIHFTDEYLIFEIPIVGGKVEDIKVTKTDDELSVLYHRSDKPVETGTYLKKGIARRNFDFSWKISPKFDLENLQASYLNGLFTVQIPWAKAAIPREVPIIDLNNQ